jgi:hypothetical protein
MHTKANDEISLYSQTQSVMTQISLWTNDTTAQLFCCSVDFGHEN